MRLGRSSNPPELHVPGRVAAVGVRFRLCRCPTAQAPASIPSSRARGAWGTSQRAQGASAKSRGACWTPMPPPPPPPSARGRLWGQPTGHGGCPVRLADWRAGLVCALLQPHRIGFPRQDHRAAAQRTASLFHENLTACLGVPREEGTGQRCEQIRSHTPSGKGPHWKCGGTQGARTRFVRAPRAQGARIHRTTTEGFRRLPRRQVVRAGRPSSSCLVVSPGGGLPTLNAWAGCRPMCRPSLPSRAARPGIRAGRQGPIQ